MADAHTQAVLDLLHALSRTGLPAARRLFWSELNYDRVDEPLPTRAWPAAVSDLLAEEPVLLAQHASPAGNFDIVHITLHPEARGHNFPLSVAAERLVVEQLLADHPYALFLFSDVGHRHWHFVNVKYRRENGAQAGARAVLRRISVGPEERLRTAAERVAMLDLAALSPHLEGLSPLAIQQRHDLAFDVEQVTQDFFTTYRRLFELTESLVQGLDGEEEIRLFTQRLFNRLLFIVFLERKGWLAFEGRTDYLQALWETYLAYRESDAEANFYEQRLKVLFFHGLNNPASRDLMSINRGNPLQQMIGDVPYLNGGLFEREELDDRGGIVVPDSVFARAIEELLYHYNFTVTESTPLDVEVAVDPEMLGRIFEELVTGRHETGSYYTPKPVVAFMCREALKGYLHDTCPREEDAALAAFVNERDAAGIRDPERVLGALRIVRACDPACGSGAYLVGLLHELVDLRQALFSTRGLDARGIYDKKLEIIRHSLYGVDIDPFAVNIAQLRLWLSLIVDFEGDVPPPLPNLAYKIEVGDSLTAPAPAQLQPDLFHHQLVEEYFALKGQFMTAHGPDKLQLQARIEQVKQEIAVWAGTSGDPGAFDWTVEFAEIFTASGDGAPAAPMPLVAQEARARGFDIIVANPPYVRQEMLLQAQKERFRTVYPEVYAGTADLYVYFYARALHLLREGGVAAFISSNKWLRAGYGKKLRSHLTEKHTVEAVIDFGDLPLFRAAAYPMIVVFRKAPPTEAHTLRALVVESLDVVDRLSQVVAAEAWLQPQASLRVQGWALVEPGTRSLLRKLRESGVPLGEYVKGQIYYGIKTGYNRAFVIDQATRDRLVAEDARSAEIIKPWLRGRDVKRWYTEWGGEYLIFTRRSIDIDAYPAIRNYLTPFKKRLTPGVAGGRKPGSYEWYEIQDSVAYYPAFERPKILYPDIAKRCEFTFDDRGYYSGNTTYIIPEGDLMLLGVLNSKVVEFFYRHICSMIQQDYLRFFTQYLMQIPIREPASGQRDAIESVVRKLLDAHGQGPQAAAWEEELNALVYEAYGLTHDEIALIEEETGR